MQYIHKNKDETIGVITLIPVGIIENDSKIQTKIVGVRRKDGKCFLYGSSKIHVMFKKTIEKKVKGKKVLKEIEEPQEMDVGINFIIGKEDFNLATLELDSLKGYTLIFPDIEKDIIAKYPETTRKEIVSLHKTSPDKVPTDRYFRNAWTHDGKDIAVHMEKAKEIHKDKLRRLRAPALAKLDAEYMQALERGDQKIMDKIAGQKQALRDITDHPDIEKAKTPEKLKAVTHELLNG